MPQIVPSNLTIFVTLRFINPPTLLHDARNVAMDSESVAENFVMNGTQETIQLGTPWGVKMIALDP